MPARDERIQREFVCRRTGACCRKAGFVYLRTDEADGIASGLGMPVRDFIDSYGDLLDRRQLVLKKSPDESCIFLAGNFCRIYPFRPAQCRDFPKVWRTPASFEYCEGLRALFRP